MEQVETRHRQFEGKKLNSLFLRFLGSPSNIIIRLICILRGEFSVYPFFFAFCLTSALRTVCLPHHFVPAIGLCLVRFDLHSGLQVTSLGRGKGNAKVL